MMMDSGRLIAVEAPGHRVEHRIRIERVVIGKQGEQRKLRAAVAFTERISGIGSARKCAARERSAVTNVCKESSQEFACRVPRCDGESTLSFCRTDRVLAAGKECHDVPFGVSAQDERILPLRTSKRGFSESGRPG